MNKSSFNELFDRMTRTRIFLAVIVVLGIIGFASYSRWFKDASKQQLLMNMLVDGVRSQHYDPAPIDDKYSEKVFNLFTESKDVNKKFFTAGDMKELERYKDSIDDEIQNNSYQFFDALNTTY